MNYDMLNSPPRVRTHARMRARIQSTQACMRAGMHSSVCAYCSMYVGKYVVHVSTGAPVYLRAYEPYTYLRTCLRTWTYVPSQLTELPGARSDAPRRAVRGGPHGDAGQPGGAELAARRPRGERGASASAAVASKRTG